MFSFIRKLRESSFLRLPAELRYEMYSYVDKAECWRATVIRHLMRLGIFARANTSQPRNLAMVCHQLRAKTTYLPFTFKSSLYGGLFYSDESRMKAIRLRREQKSEWEWRHVSCKEARMRAIQSVHQLQYSARPTMSSGIRTIDHLCRDVKYGR